MISDRLKAISLLINDYECIIDIGCDHGLLDIYLTLYKNCNCSCCDVSQEIVNRAISNISKYNLIDSIDVFVGNGYDDLKIDDGKVMVLAGMGTSTILKILEKNKTNSIICQTNTDLYVLRKSVCNMGYYVSSENIVFDNGRYYITIRFENGSCDYNYDEYLLGPCLLKKNDLVFKDYIKCLYNKNLAGYRNSLKYDCNTDLSNMMVCLEKYIKKSI